MRALTAEGPQFAETLDKMPGCPRCSDPARIASTSSHEPNEPPHIHVERDDLSAKFWLSPVQAGNFGFRAHELREMQSMVTDSRQRFLEAWNEFFGIVGA